MTTPVQNTAVRTTAVRTTPRRTRFAGLAGLAAAAALGLLLAGCTGTAQAEKTRAADTLEVAKPWVKAAGSGMTGAFGEITNTGDAEVRIVGATSDASTELQLHETVDGSGGGMSMRQKEGGFVLPAGKTLELEPGGNHIMFMDLTEPLLAGQQVGITLKLSDGSTLRFDAPVKDFTGANESYHE